MKLPKHLFAALALCAIAAPLVAGCASQQGPQTDPHLAAPGASNGTGPRPSASGQGAQADPHFARPAASTGGGPRPSAIGAQPGTAR